MKKICLFVISILLVLPISALAAATPRVLTLDAKSSGSKISYNGTVEDGSHAVMCKLYSSNDEEVDLLSSAVDNKEFEGSFSNVEDGTYHVACANYEGGEVKSVEVVVNNTTANPNTYDAGISSFIIILVVSILGILGISMYLKKRKV